jgi:hypothetical protein
MLTQPKVRMFIEMDAIILEVEDEGTMIKVDFTDKILKLVDELKSK